MVRHEDGTCLYWSRPCGDRWLLCLLGLDAAWQTDLVAASGSCLAYRLCLLAHVGRNQCGGQGLCRIWRRLHRRLSVLAMGRRRYASRPMGHRRCRDLPDWCGRHYLRSARIKLITCHRSTFPAALAVAHALVAAGPEIGDHEPP